MAIFKKLNSFHLYLLVATLLLYIIILYINHDGGEPTDFPGTENHQEIIDAYAEKYSKAFQLKIDTKFTKDSLYYYLHQYEIAGIWIDIHYETKDSCLYEIKGATNANVGIIWRFYIYTQDDKIHKIEKSK